MTNAHSTADELCSAINKFDRDGDIKGVKLLLEQGANPNAMNANGALPLLLASGKSLALVEMLVEHGADVNAKNGHGLTPLTSCIIGGVKPPYEAACIDILHFLIAKGADLEHIDSMGVSALLWAESVKNKTAMEILVKALRKPGELHHTAMTRQEALKQRRLKFKKGPSCPT